MRTANKISFWVGSHTDYIINESPLVFVEGLFSYCELDNKDNIVHKPIKDIICVVPVVEVSGMWFDKVNLTRYSFYHIEENELFTKLELIAENVDGHRCRVNKYIMAGTKDEKYIASLL